MSTTLRIKLSAIGSLPRQMHTRPRILSRVPGTDELELIAPSEDEFERIAYRRHSNSAALDRTCQRRLKPAPFRP